MEIEPIKSLHPDAKGRINLGHLADGVSHYKVFRGEGQSLILEPYADIPLNELWLWQNKAALDSVTRGMDDLKAGRSHPLNQSFLNDMEDIDLDGE